MKVLLLSQPFEPKTTDVAFQAEREAAIRAGLTTALVDVDALDDGAFDAAVSRLPREDTPTTSVFRGWMMNDSAYSAFFAALEARGHVLVNRPEEYRYTHHLPEWYPELARHTPQTVWTTTAGELHMDTVMELLEPFGDAPIIVKDYVKSQKHHWSEACFIPAASDADAVRRVTSRFIELQGTSLTGGLVYRAYEDLAPLTKHSKSNMPLTQEYRIFMLDQQPILSAEYWEEGAYDVEGPSPEWIAELVRHVKSRFFTVDVARRRNGEWILMELGDGQVAGIPPRVTSDQFYGAIAARLVST